MATWEKIAIRCETEYKKLKSQHIALQKKFKLQEKKLKILSPVNLFDHLK